MTHFLTKYNSILTTPLHVRSCISTDMFDSFNRYYISKVFIILSPVLVTTNGVLRALPTNGSICHIIYEVMFKYIPSHKISSSHNIITKNK
jgi:hypothetical protein